MPNYLIDVNLPYYFSLWNSEEYIHQIDIQNDSEDYEIWDYAKERGMTIITKDADFSDRILLSTPPPRVIHLRIGNVSMRDFHMAIGRIWNDVTALSHDNKLVTVFKDRIEAVN
ncbi:hypothetical protein GCM10027341_10120 [Spirosoma knui]